MRLFCWDYPTNSGPAGTVCAGFVQEPLSCSSTWVVHVYPYNVRRRLVLIDSARTLFCFVRVGSSRAFRPHVGRGHVSGRCGVVKRHETYWRENRPYCTAIDRTRVRQVSASPSAGFVRRFRFSTFSRAPAYSSSDIYDQPE